LKQQILINMETQHPLILVFYLDKELMSNPQIIQPFAESVNQTIAARNSNIIAFFIPTTGEEWVDCINPILVEPTKMEEINKMIEDIKKNFSIDVEVGNDEIILDEKPCTCGCNPEGKCLCD